MRILNKTRVAASIIGIFAGLGGASHGPGEILQGNVAPTDVMIKAWPSVTALGGEPAMTIIPNFIVTGVLAIIFGVLVAAWAGAYVETKMGGLFLILLSIIMLLVGGGIVPPFFGIAAGIIGALINRNAAKQGADITKTSIVFGTKGKNSETVDPSWKNLYRVGAAAALIAALVFRRNIGAEITLFTGQAPPNTVVGWFTLLHDNSLLGLSFLNVFDIVDYALVGLMFLALYVELRRTNKSFMFIATALGLAGIVVYFISNTTFSMLSLSNQYASATTDAQRSMLLVAGQAVLANGNPGAIYQGTGVYTSFFFLAVADLIISAVMLRSNIFSKVTAYVGILASAFDLAYCITLAFLPAIDVFLLSASGLLLMIWHILIGRRLYQLGRSRQNMGALTHD